VSQGIINSSQVSGFIKNFVSLCNEAGEVGFEPTTGILEIRRGRIRTHDKDFGDPYYNQLNYTPLLKT
jgi:hypothetical protein